MITAPQIHQMMLAAGPGLTLYESAFVPRGDVIDMSRSLGVVFVHPDDKDAFVAAVKEVTGPLPGF